MPKKQKKEQVALDKEKAIPKIDMQAPRKVKKPNPTNEPIFHLENSNDFRMNLKTVNIEGNPGDVQNNQFRPPNPLMSYCPSTPQKTRRPSGIPQSFLQTKSVKDNNAWKQNDNQIYQFYDPSQASDAQSPDESGADGQTSVFSRLGPISAPARPKLTINLTTNNDETVRDVTENEEIGSYIPAYDRDYIVNSNDEIVKKYLPIWPRSYNINDKSLNLGDILLKKDTSRHLEKMYSDKLFYKYTVFGYPRNYTKEDVLDLLIGVINDKAFVPCFVEFSPRFCSFIIVRCQKALTLLYNMKLKITKETFELTIRITKLVTANVNTMDFIPRLVVRKRILMMSDGQKLDLSAFCLQKDISHIIYFPLNDVGNQSELNIIEASTLKKIVELDLSNNRLTTIKGFNLAEHAPNLKKLDLSNNKLERFGELIALKGLMLRSINLDNNPLCQNFLQTEEYVQCLKMLFPTLVKIDGVIIKRDDILPEVKQNYCPLSAQYVVAKYLEVFYPLIDTSPDERMLLAGLYDEEAILSVSFRRRLRNHPQMSCFHKLFYHASDLRAGIYEPVKGADNIITLLCKWPDTLHDPSTFHCDVLHHDDKSTTIHIEGVMKIPSSNSSDGPLIFFARTVLLLTNDGVNYLIKNEMVTWDAPSEAYTTCAFKTLKKLPKTLKMQFETIPNAELREKLIQIFMKITESDHSYSEKSLALTNWNLTKGIENFMSELTTCLKQ